MLTAAAVWMILVVITLPGQPTVLIYDAETYKDKAACHVGLSTFAPKAVALLNGEEGGSLTAKCVSLTEG